LRFRPIIKTTLGILLGLAMTLALQVSPAVDSPAATALLTEAIRVAGTTFFGLPVSLGIAAAQAYQSSSCQGALSVMMTFFLLLPPNLLLGLLWQRYRLRGGLVAIFLSGLWQLSIIKPAFWPLLTLGFLAAAAFLLYPILFHPKVTHETQTNPA
jgi:hypothetical protein